MQHENKSHYSYGSRSSSKLQSRPTYSHSEELLKYNPSTDGIRNITCWRCGNKGHTSFICNLPPPQPEVQALCDPCTDITVPQQSCVPADSVIHPWTDGEFQVVDHEIKLIGWISLHISVGKIGHFMPKVDIFTQPFSLILGFDWQQQVQARCIYEPKGSLCISTTSAFHLYECIQASKPSISYISPNKLSLQPLNDVILPVAVPSLFHTDTQLIPKPSHSLTKDIIHSKNIYSEHESNETLNAVTFTKKDSQSIHVPEERSVSKGNKNYLLKVPNYEKYKIEESDRCETREN
ncbi:hypothetical protein AVEN_232672-1 [Araneus ventricosus]|uniref:CCHC-type domain-containing protein n=1 Tax=Araneus ventricosus TaxID=182803 RepID=A0A4Y2R4F6_ARAVE|nr:hypothetical protein AVEN_228434-1 [Araneus ventricosus]GBN70383.1 hypothetical protein AVEN_232672-1 [Araneus ventricosus]